MNSLLFTTGLVQGLLLAMIAYAVMIPFRLLNFPDLTVEGAYPLGGAVCASMLLLTNSPYIALLFGVIAAAGLNVATGLIYLRFKVNTLLAGIILSTMAYSINLHVLGKPNVALFELSHFLSMENNLKNCFLLSLFLVFFMGPFFLFLRTDFGLKLRAVGLNPAFARQQKIAVGAYTLLGLGLAGCMSGLAGGLMVQLQHYMDINMGVGIVVHGLAALMLGEALLGQESLVKQLLSPLLGAMVYQQIQGLVLSLGLPPADLKLFTGGMVILVIAMKGRV